MESHWTIRKIADLAVYRVAKARHIARTLQRHLGQNVKSIAEARLGQLRSRRRYLYSHHFPFSPVNSHPSADNFAIISSKAASAKGLLPIE